MIFNQRKLKQEFSRELAALAFLTEPIPPFTQVEADAIKRKILLVIAAEPEFETSKQDWSQRTHKFTRLLMASLVGVFLLCGTALASSVAKPGDALYPVKLAKEKVELKLVVSEQSKAELQAKFATNRLNELRALSLQTKSFSNLNSSATSTSQGNSTSTVASSENQKHKALEAEAKHEAGVEVSHALSVLQAVKIKLEAKGNTRAASSIGESILRLRSQAQAQSINTFESPGNTNQSKDPEGLEGHTATSTSQTGVKTEVKGATTHGGRNFKFQIKPKGLGNTD